MKSFLLFNFSVSLLDNFINIFHLAYLSGMDWLELEQENFLEKSTFFSSIFFSQRKAFLILFERIDGNNKIKKSQIRNLLKRKPNK